MLRLSASQALAGSRNAAAHLQTAGVSRGHRVAFAVTRPADSRDAAAEQAMLIQAVWGALRSGIVPVMVNPDLPRIERDALLADCEPNVTLTHASQLSDLVADGAKPTTNDSGTFTARPMHYTSGTTGQAKGVWTGFVPGDEISRWWSDEQEQWGFDASDVTLVHGPLSSSAPLRHSLLVLAAGGDVLLPGKFDPIEIARSLAEDKPTTAFTVPSHWQRLFSVGALPASPYRVLAHAGSPCPPDLKRRLHAWAGADRVWEFYGSTEGQFTACSGTEWDQRPGTLGRARSGREILIDDGVIWCRTPEYSRFEYWHDPAKTAAAWRTLEGGGDAFTVGDLGRLDADGYLYLDGRREDLIITGGMNVYPAQVEAALSAVPGVREAAVFGLDDEEWGQMVCAVIAGDVADGALHEALAQSLARYQQPKRFFRLPEIPRNAMGKVQRLELPIQLGLIANNS